MDLRVIPQGQDCIWITFDKILKGVSRSRAPMQTQSGRQASAIEGAQNQSPNEPSSQQRATRSRLWMVHDTCLNKLVTLK
ncbi:unnamed protein product [Larinioides sclopetarius]